MQPTAEPAPPPEHLVCPITGDVFKFPVKTPTGHTYERQALLSWFNVGGGVCPCTRLPIDPEQLEPDDATAFAVAEWLRSNGLPVSALAGDAHEEDGDVQLGVPGHMAALRCARSSVEAQLAALQELQKLAWESEPTKVAIAADGGTATLLGLVLRSPDDPVRWHAAEVLSLLALVDTLRDAVVDACARSLTAFTAASAVGGSASGSGSGCGSGSGSGRSSPVNNGPADVADDDSSGGIAMSCGGPSGSGGGPMAFLRRRFAAARRATAAATAPTAPAPAVVADVALPVAAVGGATAATTAADTTPTTRSERLRSATALVEALADGGSSDESRVGVAWALWVLSLDAGLRAAALSARTVAALVGMLSASSSPPTGRANASCQMAAARLLRSFALADHRGLLFSLGAVAALVATLRGGSGDEGEPEGDGEAQCEAQADSACCGVRMAACSALCNVDFAGDAAVVDLIATLAVLPSVRSLLLSGDPHWQGWAARFVRSLAPAARGPSMVSRGGLLRPLVALVASRDEHCQLTACSALYKLLEGGGRVRARLGRMGLAAALAAVITASSTGGSGGGSSSYPLRFVAARTLTELAVPENYDAFCEPPAVLALEVLLQQECEHCQYFAAVSLLNVGHAAGRIPLGTAECGTFRGLIRLLSSSAAQYRCAAAAVLRHLSRCGANRPYLVKLGAIHALLEVCCQDGGRCPLEAAGALQAIARSGSFYRRQVLDACSTSAGSSGAGAGANLGSAIGDASGADDAASGAAGDVSGDGDGARFNLPYLLGCL